MDVRSPGTSYAKNHSKWHLVDALLSGTAGMREAGLRYLPQWQAEDRESYRVRLSTTTLFPAFSRTIDVLIGKPFSKPITVGEDVPPQLVEWLEDVDLQGRNLNTFAADVCRQAFSHGLAGILVDCPAAVGARTIADERGAGIRPYMVDVRADAVLGWRSDRGVLTQLRLLETVQVDDGPYDTRTVEQVRLLEPGLWAIFRKTGDVWLLHEQGATSLPIIPFVPVYGARTAFMQGTPPLLELAHLNVEHWQSKSDQQTILHVARVPVLFASGLGDAPIVVGAGALISTGSAEARLAYVEHSGRAIEAGRQSLLDLEAAMRQIGAELLVIKPGNTTRVQTLADNEMGACDLQRIMQSCEDAFDQALDIMAQWVGLPDGGHISIYRDFGALSLAEASASLLLEMQGVGCLSRETLLYEMKRRGILSPDIDVAAEIVRAVAERPATAVKIDELVKP